MRTTAMTKELASEFASDQMRELTETELNSVGGGYEDAYKNYFDDKNPLKPMFEDYVKS